MHTSRRLNLRRPLLMAMQLGFALFAMVGLTRISYAAPLVSASPAPAAPLGGSNLGDYVWFDTNYDGQHPGAEAEFKGGINGVLVNLYLDKNKDGVIDPGEFEQSMLTGDNPNTPSVVETGWYDFAVTADGNQYIVQIDASNYASGKPLYGYLLTSDSTYGPSPMIVPLPDVIMDYSDADFGFAKSSDWGDLPDLSYPTLAVNNGPRHQISSPLRLGAMIDAEFNGQPDPAATGDNATGPLANDEDGVAMKPGVGGGVWADGAVSAGRGGSLEIVITGGSGLPQAFADFDGLGLKPVTLRDASGAELPVFSFAPWVPNTYRVYFDIPAGTMAPGPKIPVRVRLSSAGGLAATGAAPDGEVEDYIFSFRPTAVSLASFSAGSGSDQLLIGLVGAALGAVLLVWLRGRHAAPQRR